MGTLATCSDPTVLTIEACHAPAGRSAPYAATAAVPSIAQPQAPAGISLFDQSDFAESHSRSLSTAAASTPRLAWENPSDVPGSFDDFKSVMLL